MTDAPTNDDAKTRPPARAHHHRFKEAIVTRALAEPARFVETCTTREGLEAFWQEIGGALTEADRSDRRDSAGLDAKVIGDLTAPVVMVTLPPPERPNEAYYLAALPTHARIIDGSLRLPAPGITNQHFRVFGMERSVLPNGGLIGFVVEWTGAMRRNYDAPSGPSQGAFWAAILEVCSGTRPSLHAMEMRLAPASAIDQLERATWFANVGRPNPNVKVVSSWAEANSLLMTEERMARVTAPIESAKPLVQAVSPLVHDLLTRKFRAPLATATENRTLSMFVQLDLLSSVIALDKPGPESAPAVAFDVAKELVFFYGEGRVPLAWEGDRVTTIF
jgi:hypothetical protein